MLKKEYRNRLILTGAMLLGILLFTIVDGFIRYAPENAGETPGTEIVSETEINE